MTYRVINRNCVTVLIHNDEKISAADTASLVRRALAVCGYAPWRRVRAELYRGIDESLLIAAPGEDGI